MYIIMEKFVIAERIYKFVQNYLEDNEQRLKIENFDIIGEIVISCDAGESRSAAIGAVLAFVHNKSIDFYFKNDLFYPNVFVYSIVIKAWNKIINKKIEETKEIIKSIKSVLEMDKKDTVALEEVWKLLNLDKQKAK